MMVRDHNYRSVPDIGNHNMYFVLQVDVWSAGIVLYTMLTARLPFDVDSKVKNYLKLLVKVNWK